MSDDKFFRTTDYKLAAFLLVRNFSVDVRPNPRRPTKAEFFCPATDEVYRAAAEFNADEPVPVQTYNESIEAVKDRMMDVRRGNRS